MTSVKEAAQEYASGRVDPCIRFYSAEGFEAGWNAALARELTDEEVEAMARASFDAVIEDFGRIYPRWDNADEFNRSMMRAAVRAAYAALSRLRGPT